MIPVGWQQGSLGDDIILISGQHLLVQKYDDDPEGIPYLTGPSDYSSGKIVATKFTKTPKALCQKGDILITVKGSGTGKTTIADRAYCISRQLMAIRPKSWDSYFLWSVVRYHETKYEMASAGLIPGISRDEVLLTPILIPPIAEQREISHILLAWDRVIDLNDRLIIAKKERRAWVMQQLFSGKRRLPRFSRQWRRVTLSEVAEESFIRNQGQLGTNAVRAVTKAEGMIPMKSHVMADDISRYKVIQKRWFAYNPMRINIGSICQWMGDEDALVSPDYVVFRCKDDRMDYRFFNAFLKSHQWSSFMDVSGNGSVRVRIYFEDLARMKLFLPSLDEQRRIAEIFELANFEIELLNKLLAAYREQKKGLMQQLLTGRTRVSI